MWSGLARESGVSVNISVEYDGPFASKPAPTLVFLGVAKTVFHRDKLTR